MLGELGGSTIPPWNTVGRGGMRMYEQPRVKKHQFIYIYKQLNFLKICFLCFSLIDSALCESQWTSFGSSCYKLHTSPQNWNNAKVNCQNFGGKLVKIETEEESRFITRKYFSNKGRYWIGLSDSSKEKEWRWTDKTGLTGYKNWRSGQPNNFLNQDCVAMLKGTYHFMYFNAEWNDEDCSLTLGYICEKKWTLY